MHFINNFLFHYSAFANWIGFSNIIYFYQFNIFKYSLEQYNIHSLSYYVYIFDFLLIVRMLNICLRFDIIVWIMWICQFQIKFYFHFCIKERYLIIIIHTMQIETIRITK